MNTKLYRITVLHGAPKSSHTSTETYLVAKDDETVCGWIDENKQFGMWFDEDDSEEGFEPKTRWDEETDSDMSFREWVMKNQGDMNDEEGWEDAYYGVTKWGWKLVDASPEEIAILLKLGIAISDD